MSTIVQVGRFRSGAYWTQDWPGRPPERRRTTVKINGYPVVRYEVEAHIVSRGKSGIGQGPETGHYLMYDNAVRAMARAVAHGHGATCIARNAKGQGRILLLGLVRPISLVS